MNKEEENFIKSQDNNPVTHQADIDKDLNRLNRGPMRVDETVEEYNERENEKIEKQKLAQETQNDKEITEVQNEINTISSTELCKNDLLAHLNSPEVNWYGIEGRINSMLSEIQNIERSEETMKINTKLG